VHHIDAWQAVGLPLSLAHVQHELKRLASVVAHKRLLLQLQLRDVCGHKCGMGARARQRLGKSLHGWQNEMIRETMVRHTTHKVNKKLPICRRRRQVPWT
jgi:hypothetical protein